MPNPDAWITGPASTCHPHYSQWMTWAASSATVAFEGSSAVTVVLDGSKAAFPNADEWVFTSKSTVPEAVFEVRHTAGSAVQLIWSGGRGVQPPPAVHLL